MWVVSTCSWPSQSAITEVSIPTAAVACGANDARHACVRFFCQRRTGAGGDLTYLASRCSTASRLSLPRLGDEKGASADRPLGEPNAQEGDYTRGDRCDPLLPSFPHATDMGAGAEMNIDAKADQFGRPKARLGRERKQGVAPPGPGRAVGCARTEASSSGSIRKVTILRSKRLRGMASTRSIWRHARDVEALRIGTGSGRRQVERCECATILPLLLKMVEEGADERRIKIVDV